MSISKEEVWLRTYTAVLTGLASRSFPSYKEASADAQNFADLALEKFAEKFPSFQFISNENKKE